MLNQIQISNSDSSILAIVYKPPELLGAIVSFLSQQDVGKQVILAAKNLYKKLMEEKDRVMVVDWYKDEQPKKKVLALIQVSLDKDLPESYDRAAFTDKTNLLMNHFIDMAVQGYGWTAA